MTGLKTADEIKLGVQQVTLESVEFRHRTDPLDVSQDRPESTPAEVRVDLRDAEDKKSAAVRVRVICDAPESPYHYSVSYIVILTFEAEITETLREQLVVTGGNMAMPFCRELIGNLSSRARYGSTWLAPVDFAAMVRERQERAAARRALAPGTTAT
jgi:preprotein translocase subunit SecB